MARTYHGSLNIVTADQVIVGGRASGVWPAARWWCTEDQPSHSPLESPLRWHDPTTAT